MSRRSTKEELRSWLERWEIVNQRTRDENRALSAEEKLRRISDLMESAHVFDLSRRESGDPIVRELWHRLRAGMSLETLLRRRPVR